MFQPHADVTAIYEASLPEDERVQRKLMFGMPCAFVNRQMFFGTFERSIIARVGPERVAALAQYPEMRVFSPSEGRTWPDYVQVEVTEDTGPLKKLATEALNWTDRLPAKAEKPKAVKKAQLKAKKKARAAKNKPSEPTPT